MRIGLIAAALCAVSAAPALAQDAPATPPVPKPEKKICRSIVPTGSIMGKRFCLTKTEWKEFDGLNQENAEDAIGKKVNIGPKELNK